MEATRAFDAAYASHNPVNGAQILTTLLNQFIGNAFLGSFLNNENASPVTATPADPPSDIRVPSLSTPTSIVSLDEDITLRAEGPL